MNARDPIPPGHGEPEPVSFGRGSNTYTDEDWDDLGTWLAETSAHTAREEHTHAA